ncbi:MAG: glycoside-pentoside-hexuronide (GPH):cation symporter [Myxococcota bacterium]
MNAVGSSGEDRRFTVGRKLVYGSGDFTINTVLSALSLVYVTYFLTQVVGLRAELAGAVQLVGRIVDALTDPAMGRFSDSRRWRWGRRRPFLLLGALPFGACFALLWVVIPDASQWSMFAYYSAVYVGMSLSTTVISIPYLSLQPEMALGYDARTSLNTYRSIGAILGVFAAVFFRPLAHSLADGPVGYTLAGLCFGFMIALPWFAIFAATWERPDLRSRAEPAPLREALRALAQHHSFRRLAALYLCGRVAIDLASTMLILYFSYVVGRGDDFEYAMLLMLAAVVLSMPLWLRVSQRRDKAPLFVVGALWWAVMQATLLFAQPDWPRWLLLVFAPIMGIGYAAMDLIPWAMVGEVVDEDELEHGERREGLYYGVFTFLRKLTGTTAVWLALSLLGYLGLVQGEEQNEATRLGIRLLTGGGPIFFLLLAAGFARNYPLDRARHRKIVAALEARRATTG